MNEPKRQGQGTWDVGHGQKKRLREGAIGKAVRTVFERLEERRLLSAGQLDTTFAGSGKVHTDFAAGQDDGNAIAALSDGGVVVAGQAGAEFGLARYGSDGTLVWSKHTAIGG